MNAHSPIPVSAVAGLGSVAAAFDTSGLRPEYQAMFEALLSEVIALRGAATVADMALVMSAVQNKDDEADIRELMQEAFSDVDGIKQYQALKRLAMASSRTAMTALSQLGLSGDRRGAAEVKRHAHAINSGAGVTASNKWDID